MSRSPTLDDVRVAQQNIRDSVMATPCRHSRTLSGVTGCDLWLKFENLQFTASFKERGALHKLLSLGEGERAAGVCAMSAGNHAQGLAYHASRLRVPATIFMPKGTPFTKVSRTGDLGAEVRIEGDNLSQALDAALAHSARTGATFIHPYDDPLVIAGQGTLGLEILDAVPEPDVLVVPIGGGGLISGVATAVKALRPGIEVIGVQSRTYPSMVRALAGDDAPCPDGLSIAEGIAVKTAGALTREIVRTLVDDILLVEETSIERAIALLLSIEKTVVEGAGAAGLAALLEHPARFSGKRVVTPLCGGNIDLRVLASVAMRDLVRSGRLLRLSVPVIDLPGSLSRLTTIMGEAGANILEIAHDRLSLAYSAKGAVLDVVVEVQDARHGERLVARLREKGFAPQPSGRFHPG